ncbi:hypothetical protein EDI_031560 [Entamoeba dispar SAW760]|uniref:Uncharacterized protein n=1 Tax=Entamoeba dispar (strain ATCC PRA-260 / SAW760) TaxID=370354 RepID=B0EQN6_ENTDS|nr:uncharacterized protein EDI_031560 [Entamoeba dispar SAW760]EDR23155.1 hypothetical protein EDI_031560 [Entamoeba dispar SAW760]|eukprot:EDR23155.1 hypothetical protein EDI_031560 [Entamoeba dispar SAW760]
MWGIFCFITIAFAIDGSSYSQCSSPYQILKYPLSEEFTFDPNSKNPGICGEDSEDVSSIWVELKNDGETVNTYTIDVNSSIAVHNTCDSECIDALSEHSTLTVAAKSSLFLVLKGSGVVSISISENKISSSENPVSVTVFPYEEVFTTAKVSSTCSGLTEGVFLEFPDMAKVPVTLSTCGSTAAVQVILHKKDSCEVPEQSICENGNGIIATFIGEPMTIELLGGNEGDFNEGSVSVQLKYDTAPECENATEFNVDEKGGVLMRTVYSGIPKSDDRCSKELYSYDIVHINGVEKTEITFTVSKDVKYEIHIFENCEMKECIESISKNENTTTFNLDLTEKSYYIKVGINANENVDYTLHIKGDDKENGLSTGMKVFIGIFIVVAVITIIAGIIAIIFAVVKTKKSGYSNI